jgi:pilus assembly protein Flp/PilA
MRIVSKLLGDRRGAAAIEYALVASLISIAALAGYQSVGVKVVGMYTNVDTAIENSL